MITGRKKWSDSMLDKTIFSKWLYQENSYMKEADTALIQKYLEVNMTMLFMHCMYINVSRDTGDWE